MLRTGTWCGTEAWVVRSVDALSRMKLIEDAPHHHIPFLSILCLAGPWTMRDVAQMTWSLGVLNQPELPFLEACQQAVSRRMSEASAVDVTNLMWGYASLNTPPSSPCMQMHAVSLATYFVYLVS